MALCARLCARAISLTRTAVHKQEHVCNYSRWMHRRPSKVFFPNANSSVNEENIVDLSEGFDHFKTQSNILKQSRSKGKQDDKEFNSRNNLKSKHNKKSKNISPVDNADLFDLEELDAKTHSTQNEKEKQTRITDSRNNPKKEKIKVDRQKPAEEKPKAVVKPIFDSDGRLQFEKLDYNDRNISNLIIKLKSRKTRGLCGQIMVEGWRLIADGLTAGCKLELLLFSQISELEKIQPYMPRVGPRLCKMPYKELQMWSNLDTCPGIVGIFKTPDLLNIPIPREALPINIVCDNIREPGNLGSILRASLGVGCEKVMLTKGCADIWDGKVMRSAAGAHFRMPISTGLEWEDISKKISSASSIFIADNNTNEHIMDKFTARKMQEKNEEKNEGEGNMENELFPINIPLLPYFAVDYSKLHSITVVIGGETMGISEECYRFARDRSGARLNVPLVAGVDSLNSSTALAVIAFEIKRQCLMNAAKKSFTRESVAS